MHGSRLLLRMPVWQVIVGLALTFAVGATAYAQVRAPEGASGGFDLSWSTIDSGGGTSTGGTFDLSGTSGQPDAGLQSGGGFSIEGGFWGGAAAPVGPALLVGHVTWQGRPAQPNALQSLPITLTLCLPGGSVHNFPGMTTDGSGHFTATVTGLAAGNYNWWVKGPKYLASAGTVNLTGAAVTNQEIGLMRAGDADNNNLVTAVDFTIVRNTFGLSQGNQNYDDRADFNGDQIVSSVDFTLLRNNFGTGGATLVCP